MGEVAEPYLSNRRSEADRQRPSCPGMLKRAEGLAIRTGWDLLSFSHGSFHQAPAADETHMTGRQLIHSQSAPERERPDAAPLGAGLHVAKSSSGRLERGQSVANSDGAKVLTYPTPPNWVLGPPPSLSGASGGPEPSVCSPRGPRRWSEMAAGTGRR